MTLAEDAGVADPKLVQRKRKLLEAHKKVAEKEMVGSFFFFVCLPVCVLQLTHCLAGEEETRP